MAAFWDARGSAIVARPEVPGPEFRSGVLWDASSYAIRNQPGVRCEHQESPGLEDVAEDVRCFYPNGAVGEFVLPGDEERFVHYRAVFGSDVGSVPGTHKVGTVTVVGTDRLGQLVESVNAADGVAHIYLDQPEDLAFALFQNPEFTLPQLDDFLDALLIGRPVGQG